MRWALKIKKIFNLSAILQNKTKQIKIKGHDCGTITVEDRNPRRSQKQEQADKDASKTHHLKQTEGRERAGAAHQSNEGRRTHAATAGHVKKCKKPPEGGGNLRKQNRKLMVPDR